MAITVNIGGTDRTDKIKKNSLTITNILTRQVDQCSFKIVYYNSAPFDFMPVAGQEVIIYDGATKVFGGTIVQVEQTSEDFKTLEYDIECQDYTRFLNRRLIVESYVNTTVEDIILDWLYTYVNYYENVGISGLVGWWRLDSNINDSSGNALNGSSPVNITYSYGKMGRCGNFNGTDSGIVLPDNAKLQPTTGITCTAWVYWNGKVGSKGVILQRADYDNFKGLYFAVQYDNLLQFALGDGTKWNWSTGGSVPIGEWCFVAVRWNGHNMFTYINNVLVASLAFEGTVSWQSAGVYLGLGFDSQWLNENFNGKLDDVRMYNRGLTTEELTDIYNQFTTENVQCVEPVDNATFSYKTVTESMTQLADDFQYDYYVDYNRDIHFFKKETLSAPFDITDTNGNVVNDSLVIRKDNSQIKNVIYVRGGNYLGSTFTSVFISDGQQTLLSLGYEYDDLKMTVTGIGWDVGIEPQDSPISHDAMWNPDSRVVTFRVDRIPSNGSSVRVSGHPYLPVIIKKRDTVGIAAMKAIEKGSGEYEYVIIDKTITSKEAARVRAKAEIEAYGSSISEGEFLTYTSGLKAGMRIYVNSVSRNVYEYFIINRVRATMFSNTAMQYHVSMVTYKTLGIVDVLQKLLSESKETVVIGDNEILDVAGEEVVEAIALAETFTSSIDHNRTLEGFAMAETLTVESLNYETEFVLGPIVPTAKKRQFLIDGGYIS